MKKIILKLFSRKNIVRADSEKDRVSHKTDVLSRQEKIERGAKDFAQRFEGVMKDLANG